MSKARFNIDDAVRYTGDVLPKKYPDGMKKDKIGTVLSHVSGEEDAVVVDFGSDAFICHADNLSYATFKDRNEINVEVERLVRKLDQSADGGAKR